VILIFRLKPNLCKKPGTAVGNLDSNKSSIIIYKNKNIYII
jgi:hypothetical protein